MKLLNLNDCGIRLRLRQRKIKGFRKLLFEMPYRQNNITGDIPFVLGAYLLWYTGKIRDVVKENVDKILKCHTPFWDIICINAKKYV